MGVGSVRLKSNLRKFIAVAALSYLGRPGLAPLDINTANDFTFAMRTYLQFIIPCNTGSLLLRSVSSVLYLACPGGH